MAVTRCQRFGEKLTLTVFVMMTIAVFLFEITVIRPYMIENGYRFIWLHLAIGLMLLVNILGHLYKCARTDTSIIGTVMPAKLLPEWHYCYICECNVPPRSYHCNICDRCILKRDHHCAFTACCIGYKNYRYFLGLLFNVFVGSMYATILHWPYIHGNLSDMHWFVALWAHCMPMAFFIIGVTDLWTTWCNIISMICLIGISFAGGLFMYHCYLTLVNQTGWERSKRIRKYRLKDWRRNAEQALGARWWLTLFLSPSIESHLLGDGLSFPTATNDQLPTALFNEKYK